MICTIVHQLTRNLTVKQIKEQGFADYYVDHTTGLWPQAASGVPFSAATFQSTGDPIAESLTRSPSSGITGKMINMKTTI